MIKDVLWKGNYQQKQNNTFQQKKTIQN